MPVEDSEWHDDASAETLSDQATALPQEGPPVTVPGLALEPQAGDGEDASEAAESEPVPEFDSRVRDDFEGLLFLGRLTHEFTWLGHRFTIRTLDIDETLEVGLLHKPYRDTLADVKAYQAAVVAACVLKVDGKPMPGPITNEPADTALLNRFEFVRRSWFPPLLDKVYEEYLLLEGRVEQAIKAMGNRSR